MFAFLIFFFFSFFSIPIRYSCLICPPDCDSGDSLGKSIDTLRKLGLDCVTSRRDVIMAFVVVCLPFTSKIRKAQFGGTSRSQSEIECDDVYNIIRTQRRSLLHSSESRPKCGPRTTRRAPCSSRVSKSSSWSPRSSTWAWSMQVKAERVSLVAQESI